jgi:penicillin-binding protein 1C
MGHNLMGVETAAQLYFGRAAAQLTYGEAALLAALAPAPGALDPYGPRRSRLLQRRQQILQRLAQQGRLSSEELAAAVEEPPRLRAAPGRHPRFPFEAPHLVNLVLPQSVPGQASGIIKTTLNLDVQRQAEALAASHRARLQPFGASQAAAVLVDNRDLKLLALVGSLQYGPRDRGFNNGAAARRSPGSALKPFLYALALDQGFTPASILEDVERRYQTPGGEFTPANYDRSTHGPVSFREALANSLNLSTVGLLNLIGPQTYYDTLSRLDLINHPKRGPEHYGLGLVVGNPEVSLLQLAAAYACLANGGLYQPLRLRLTEAPAAPQRLFSPQAAYLVNDILADSLARFRIFGAANAMNPPYRLALKTGTSARYRDAWAVGYTPEYTVAVWVGNFDGRPTAKLSGAAGAAPIVADLVEVLFRGQAPQNFARPPGITEALVCSVSGLQPGPDCPQGRRELFISGTEPTEACSYHHHREPWLRLPVNFAGWLHQRFAEGDVGRYRLAGLDADLSRLFQEPAAGEPPAARGRSRLRPAPPAGGPRLTIAYPLNGDRFLLQPQAESLAVPLKALSQAPFPSVTCFVDGRETATLGPPYETILELSRGSHRLLVVGPDGLGDEVEVQLQ